MSVGFYREKKLQRNVSSEEKVVAHTHVIKEVNIFYSLSLVQSFLSWFVLGAPCLGEAFSALTEEIKS